MKMKQRFRLMTRSAKRSQPDLAALLRSAALALAVVSDDHLIEANSSFQALLGYGCEPLDCTAVQLNLWDLGCPPDSTQVSRSQRQLRRKAGDWVTVDLTIEPLYDRGQRYWLVLATQEFQEKAALLKEIHHRVRNNLHLISNLLDLQAGVVNDERLSALFATTQNRIQAMTLIHEQLYQSEDLSRIDFGEYLRRLVLNVFLANSNDLERVMPVIQVESVWLNLETAVPCGLLVNELLVNSLQHGFPNGQSGEVHIELDQLDQRIQIKVWDDGLGLPADFDWRQTDSLGLKLVRILAKQLKAEIQVDGICGTAVSLSFAELKYQTRF